jgi:hypothetical protein
MNEINVDAKFLTIQGTNFSRNISFLDRNDRNKSKFVVDKTKNQKIASINSNEKNAFHFNEEIIGTNLSEIFPFEKDEDIEKSLYEIISISLSQIL